MCEDLVSLIFGRHFRIQSSTLHGVGDLVDWQRLIQDPYEL
jgi:hypothetical protein